MKKLVAAGMMVSLLTGFYSCKKCSTCTYTNQFNEAVTTNETCGSKKKLDEFEQGMEDTWTEYGEVACTR